MTFLVPIQISFFIFLLCFLKISFANAKDNNAPKKQNQKVKIHHVIRKKNVIIGRGEGGSERKVDATAEKCVLSGEAEPRPRCAVQRMANHSAVSTSSHDAPVSGRRRQSNTVGLRMDECWVVQVMEPPEDPRSPHPRREHLKRSFCPAVSVRTQSLSQALPGSPPRSPNAVGVSEKWISKEKRKTHIRTADKRTSHRRGNDCGR